MSGSPIRQVEIERIGEIYGLGSRIFRCRLHAPEAVRSVVVKLWAASGPAGRTEIEFYRTFAEKAGIRLPACYHAASDSGTGRGVLILEDMNFTTQGDCLGRLSSEQATAMAETLARLHATWWEHRDLRAAEWLPSIAKYDRSSDWFRSRREMFRQKYSDKIDSVSALLLDKLEFLQARADNLLAHCDVTLLHGDLHLDNVVFLASGIPVLLDWPQVASGPAALNVSILIFDMAAPSESNRLISVYLKELHRCGGAGIEEKAFRVHLAAALVRMFSIRTCGIAAWQPATEREKRLIHVGLQRVSEAVIRWREHAPDLFE
jgi:aminoglycoside/choline kinase family phosphotransferase